LEREPELVRRDVIEGRVSPACARDSYGVVLTNGHDPDGYEIVEAATTTRRAAMRAQRPSPLPMIDRGEGYEQMLRGECAPRMR
jgi:N-methylhydantoinase B